MTGKIILCVPGLWPTRRDVVLSIAECPPGDGPASHIHEKTIENFFCLSGRFEIAWGDPGAEQSVVLEPHDFISVPPGVPRRFTNVHETETGRLCVIICHNTDNGDGWDREGEYHYYFKEFSEKKAYPLGINIIFYAMTH